jgi:hypothetical protein
MQTLDHPEFIMFGLEADNAHALTPLGGACYVVPADADRVYPRLRVGQAVRSLF